jgi:hypothetical protein
MYTICKVEGVDPDDPRDDRRLFPRVLCISSTHLTEQTAQYLQSNDAVDFQCLGGHWGNVGWMLRVDVEFGVVASLSSDLREAFEFAETLEADIILFDECGPIIPVLQIYRVEVAGDRVDEFANRQRKFDDLLEDLAGERALQRLQRNRAFQASPERFVASTAPLVDSLVKQHARKMLGSFSLKRLAALSDLVSALRLCARRDNNRYSEIRASVAKFQQTIVSLIDGSELAHHGHERKLSDLLEDINYRLDATNLTLIGQEPPGGPLLR